MKEDLSAPYPGYGFGAMDAFDGYVAYRLLDEVALTDEIAETKTLIDLQYPTLSIDQDLGLGMMLWLTHFFPDEPWAMVQRDRSRRSMRYGPIRRAISPVPAPQGAQDGDRLYGQRYEMKADPGIIPAAWHADLSFVQHPISDTTFLGAETTRRYHDRTRTGMNRYGRTNPKVQVFWENSISAD